MWDNRDITKFNIYFMQKKSKTIKLFEDIISLCCLLGISLSTLTVGFRGRIYIIMFAAEYSLSASPSINWLCRCHTSWRNRENKKLIIPMTLLYFIAEMHQWKRNFEPTLANTQIVNDFWLIYYSSPWFPAQIDMGLFTNDGGIFWGLWHPLVLMSAYHQLLACPLVLQIDDVICEQPWTKNDHL